MADDPNEPWYSRPMLGRVVPIHWKGWACLAALAAVLLCGATLDDLTRHSGGLVHALVMIPIGLLALGLAWTIASRTGR